MEGKILKSLDVTYKNFVDFCKTFSILRIFFQMFAILVSKHEKYDPGADVEELRQNKESLKIFFSKFNKRGGGGWNKNVLGGKFSKNKLAGGAFIRNQRV